MIVFVHLLNDRSGSPRVLCSTMAALIPNASGAHLYVGSDGSGFLDEVSVLTTRYWYWRTPYRVLTLFTYVVSQFCLLVRLFRSRNIDSDALIYVNTLLPFGAALYGWLTGRPVVYHLHEVSVSPAPLKWFLTTIARLTARRLVYVSDFHRATLPISGVAATTVHNALDARFLVRAAAKPYQHRYGHEDCFKVLMLASLRDYKGVPEFVVLAKGLSLRPDIHFDLVVNDDESALKHYFSATDVPRNLTLHSRTGDTALHYAQASLVLNLSRPDLCVETFGLTLLEAMAFGVPVIAPPVGGPAELVSQGVEGYLIDCRHGDELKEKVLGLADDEALCRRMSAAARRRSECFSPLAFAHGLHAALGLQVPEEFATP